jgi:hypothetical protein
MEFSSDAKRRLVDGAIAGLNDFTARRREMDPWEGHPHREDAGHSLDGDTFAVAHREFPQCHAAASDVAQPASGRIPVAGYDVRSEQV